MLSVRSSTTTTLVLGLSLFAAQVPQAGAQERRLTGATVQLYAVGTTADGGLATPLLTRPVVTDSMGNFDVTGLYTCPTPSTLVYFALTGGNATAGQPSNTAAVILAAVGPCGSLNQNSLIQGTQVTTVAAVNSLLPFITSTSAIGAAPGESARVADGFALAAQLADVARGLAPGSNLPPATGAPVVPTNTLANLTARCEQAVSASTTACTDLFAATTPPGGSAPTDIVGALIDLARNPTLSTAALFNPPPTPVYSPYETQAPASFNLPSPSPVTITPPNLLFPAVDLGSSSAPQTITLTNTGTTVADLTGSGFFGLDSPDFVLNRFCPYGDSLAPGQSCTIPITFTPTSLGTRTAYGEVLPNATTGTIFTLLTGTGVPVGPANLNASSNNVSFAATTVGTLAATQTVTLTNTGGHTVRLVAGSLSGPNASEFATSDNCNGQLTAHASCTVSISFSPSAPGQRTATIQLSTTANNTPLTITLTGTGSGGGAQAAAPSFSPGSGTYSSAQTVTLASVTPGASIFYTVDGSTPTSASTPYTGTITVAASETVNAIAAAKGSL